jgi:hypothetical protein
MEGRILVSNLHDVDSDVKKIAVSYYRAAKEAHDAYTKYENIKYAVENSI